MQWTQLLCHLLEPQDAVSLPRFTVFPGSDADVVGHPSELRVEAGLPESTRTALGAGGARRSSPATPTADQLVGWRDLQPSPSGSPDTFAHTVDALTPYVTGNTVSVGN